MSITSKSFKRTPIPHRAKNGEPMQYYIFSEDGEQESKVTRAECLAHTEETENPFLQRWFVDEESGLVIRLPRNQMGEDLARYNMRSIWSEQKYQERKSQCVWKDTSKCSQKCEDCRFRTNRTVELDKPLSNDANGEGTDTYFELSDPTDITEIIEEKAMLDTLYAALATLAQEDLDLIKDIFWHGKTERELAPLLGYKQSKSVNKRKHKILEILRQNEALKSFFE